MLPSTTVKSAGIIFAVTIQHYAAVLLTVPNNKTALIGQQVQFNCSTNLRTPTDWYFAKHEHVIGSFDSNCKSDLGVKNNSICFPLVRKGELVKHQKMRFNLTKATDGIVSLSIDTVDFSYAGIYICSVGYEHRAAAHLKVICQCVPFIVCQCADFSDQTTIQDFEESSDFPFNSLLVVLSTGSAALIVIIMIITLIIILVRKAKRENVEEIYELPADYDYGRSVYATVETKTQNYGIGLQVLDADDDYETIEAQAHISAGSGGLPTRSRPNYSIVNKNDSMVPDNPLHYSSAPDSTERQTDMCAPELPSRIVQADNTVYTELRNATAGGHSASRAPLISNVFNISEYASIDHKVKAVPLPPRFLTH